MFPSFTGSARPKRQVNLSGRNANPFVTIPGSRQPPLSHTGHHALAHAQQERVLRQQERERPPAARKIQSLWRGFKCREEVRNRWRSRWDSREAADLETPAEIEMVVLDLSRPNPDGLPYRSEEECLGQLRLLVQFVSPKTYNDVFRLAFFVSRFLSTLRVLPSLCTADIWIHPLWCLAKITIAILKRIKTASLPNIITNKLLLLLTTLCSIIPNQISSHSQAYYGAMVEVSSCIDHRNPDQGVIQERLESAVQSLIKPVSMNSIKAYEGFLSEYLVTPSISTLDGSLARIANAINYKLLTFALNELLLPENNLLHLKSHDESLWLLAYYLYFHRAAIGPNEMLQNAPEALYVNAVAKILSFLGDDIATRLDVPKDLRSADDIEFDTSKSSASTLPVFVHDEVLALVNQERVSSLFAHLDVPLASRDRSSEVSTQSSTLASFALTLLRCFPRKADDIRMWLYLGSTSRYSDESGNDRKRLPAIKYLYQIIRRTELYALISEDPRQTINLIRPDRVKVGSLPAVAESTVKAVDQQWRVMLLFFELYTFILKVMDDEEFLSGSSPSGHSQSWTRQSALPLDQIQDLTIFLKNLAFAMYWYSSEISGAGVPETKNSLAEYFGGNANVFSDNRQDENSNKATEIAVAGISRMTLTYVKGMVTGLLRMIYERE